VPWPSPAPRELVARLIANSPLREGTIHAHIPDCALMSSRHPSTTARGAREGPQRAGGVLISVQGDELRAEVRLDLAAARRPSAT